MRRGRSSLAFRLGLTMALILGVSFAAWVAIVHRSTAAAFVESRQEMLAGAPARPEAGLRRRLEVAWERGGWDAVVAEVAAGGAVDAPTAALLVIDPELRVAASSDPALAGATVSRGPEGALQLRIVTSTPGGAAELEFTHTDPTPLVDPEGAVWGHLLVLPVAPEGSPGQRFAAEVWRTAAIWLAIVMAAAVVATLLVLRRALAPVDRLTRAADDLRHGRTPEPIGEVHDAELQALAEAFEGAVDAIERTARVRRRLIADVAHELRTPVTNMRATLEACQQGLVPGDAALFETLQAETRMLQRLVEDFQQLAESDAGHLRLELQPLPLAETVRNILRGMTEAAGAGLRVDLPEQVHVLADEERLRQVLANLVDNAVGHRPGGLELTVQPAAGEDEDEVSFLVSDNGPGIAVEDRPHVFERLYRGDRSRSRATGGAGLGLSIASGLLEAMGGAIELEDSAAGASFRVTLPRAVASESSR